MSVKLPYPEAVQGTDKQKKAARANLMSALIQRGLNLLRDGINNQPRCYEQTVRLTGRILGDVIEVSIEFGPLKQGDPFAQGASEAFDGMTTGTKCWHVCFDGDAPFSSYAGSQQGFRLAIGAHMRD